MNSGTSQNVIIEYSLSPTATCQIVPIIKSIKKTLDYGKTYTQNTMFCGSITNTVDTNLYKVTLKFTGDSGKLGCYKINLILATQQETNIS